MISKDFISRSEITMSNDIWPNPSQWEEMKHLLGKFFTLIKNKRQWLSLNISMSYIIPWTIPIWEQSQVIKRWTSDTVVEPLN